ncbi:hypothetical protein VNO77_04639 [Canavalia gladiata]|uniref:Uncharacterized protein n=1 Tax=Canavalia gladiata TaxID=3824 RepID=A0AAN9RDE2_CANGL
MRSLAYADARREEHHFSDLTLFDSFNSSLSLSLSLFLSAATVSSLPHALNLAPRREMLMLFVVLLDSQCLIPYVIHVAIAVFGYSATELIAAKNGIRF